MKKHLSLKQWVLALASAWLYTQHSFAGVQVSENFDANWPGAPWNATAYSNVANLVSGWSIRSNSIATGFGSDTLSNACLFGKVMNGQAWLQSPFLSNGVGSVIFAARGANSSTNLLSLESSYDGITWFTNLVYTNAYGTWTGYTNNINSFSNQYLRIRRIDNNNVTFAIDTVRITYPTPRVTISNLTTTPSRPADQDPVVISATVAIQSVPDTLVMTNYWREWPSTSWTNWIAMTSNSPSLYTNIIPGKAIGTIIEYYARATYTSDGATYSTNSNSTNTYIVIPKSSYTNLSVTGQLNSSLGNGANYQWQGVIQVISNNPTFQFRGTSNATTTTWGDINQSVTNIPLYGFAEVTSSNITLNTTNNGSYLFAFNETNLEYSVRSCTYENFNDWTNIDASTPPHTNSTGWVLVSGNTSNDTSRIFSGTGRSAIIETDGWLQTPYLSNGVGQISLWYRNWQTTGAPTGKFQIQVSTNAVNWSDLANGTASNIISTNYLFFTASANDRDSKYVRILNTNSATRLCLDEVVIAQPGAGVSGISATPTNATMLDPITIAIDLTPYNGASISNVIAWYRFGTNVAWESATMVSTNGSRYALTNQFIGLPVGTLYYAIECVYSGFQAQPVGRRFILGDTNNNPASVTVTTVPLSRDYRYENFDTNWPGAPWGATAYSNVANLVSGWSIRSNSIATAFGSDTLSNACLFGKAMNGQAWLQSPFLSNGVGSVIFAAKGANSSTNLLSLESSYDGITWFTNLVYTNAYGTWTGYTNNINSLSNQYLRIRRIDNNYVAFAIDTVRITYPPANVAITNVFINPGYPVAGQTFTGSCDVVSLNPYFPVYNLQTTFNYWLIGGSTNSITMNRDWIQGTTNHFSLPVSLVSVFRDTPYGYNVSVTFDGYYGIDAEKQSPKTNSPSGTFTTRAFSSTFSNIIGTVNGSNFVGRLVSNGLWQTVLTTPPTNSLAFSFTGNGYSVGAGYATNATPWGNTNNWQTAFPLADTAGTDQTAFVISGSSNAFSGQYVIRFDETTRQYLVVRCVWQNFDQGSGDGTPYIQKNVSATNSDIKVEFDDWAANTSQTRLENFSNPNWINTTNYSDWGNGGSLSYFSWGMIYTNYSGTNLQTRASVNDPYDSFIGQATHWDPQPSLRGIDTITAKIRTLSNNVAALAVYLMPTNGVNDLNDLKNTLVWVPLASWSGISNSPAPTNLVINLKTNATLDVIFSATQNMYVAELSVSEWHAADNAKNGWTAFQSWIVNNACLFQASRSAPGAEQYLLSPALSGGVSTISFDYSSLTTTPASLSLDVSYSASPFVWTNLVTINNALFNGSGTDLSNRQYALLSAASPIYVRIKNTTPAPGNLIIDNVQISGFASSNDWYMNSAAIKYQPQGTPPAARQYYQGAGYLNSNRTSEVSTVPELIPSTNVYPCIRTPSLANGIGEISFWYRNWAVGSNPAPARLLIQKSMTGNASTSDWSYVDAITNIVNTNDYVFYQTSLYDTNNRYIRIVNDDTYSTTGVGRVCLDDILVTEPWASRLSLSNLVTYPAIPLYTDRVDVAVDVYNLFYNPSSLILTAYYGSASSYTGLASASLTALPMTCISSNLTVPGKSYRYQTSQSIPTNASDTFVKYYVKASFSGYHTEVSSPMTNKQFTVYPSWLYPLNSVNGTNQAYYVVFSCPTGTVWINEFNITDWSYGSSYQFVELCGKSGSDMLNWKFQVLDSLAHTQNVYSITNSVFNNVTNGFGFWVIGKPDVTQKQQTLTNDLPGAGGIRVSRPSGVTVDAICYTVNGNPASGVSALISNGFTFVDKEWSILDTSVILTGSNTNGFSWQLGEDTYYSPGQINDGQTFVLITDPAQSTPPNFSIYSFRIDTNVWIECTGTNSWIPAPWYSTNLMVSNAWSVPSGVSCSALSPSNTYAITFPRNQFTNNPAYFFKVVVTNAP